MSPNTRILALWDTSTVPPTLKYFTPAIDGSLVAYTPVGPVSDCPETDTEESQICYIALNAGTGYAAGDQLLQILFWDTGENPPTLTATIWRNQTQDSILSAAPLLTDLGSCGSKDQEFVILCDKDTTTGTATKFLRRYAVDSTGTVVTFDTNLDGVTAYTPAGTVEICRQCGQIEVLCDDNGSFLRNYGCDGVVTDTALDGTTAYTATGTVKRCDFAVAYKLLS